MVFTLGNETISPLRLNPLAPPSRVRCEVHQSAVMASLKLALPLFPPQPQILAKAIARTYSKAQWDDDTTISDGIDPPTLRDLLKHYRIVFNEIGYEGEARNIGLAFQTRLESLLQGSRGKLLDTIRSSNFDDLLSKPVVIEMNEIHDADEKAVLAAFLLDRIRAAANKRGAVTASYGTSRLSRRPTDYSPRPTSETVTELQAIKPELTQFEPSVRQLLSFAHPVKASF